MKTVVITGGKGDIAKAIANLLSDSYSVRLPGKEELDVTNIDSVKNYFGKIVPDILINNAGYVVPMDIADCDVLSEQKAININLFGVFNCTSSVLSKNKNAQIINIGSSAATKVHGTWSSYCASKAGVVMATKCWAEAGHNVICISPGRTATKMRKNLFPNEDQNTLLNPSDFSKIVLKAINGEYPPGSHINVNKDNVKELLNDRA